MPSKSARTGGTTGPGGKFDSTGNREQVIRHREQVKALLQRIGTAGYDKATPGEKCFIDDCRIKMQGANPTFGWRQVESLQAISSRVCSKSPVGLKPLTSSPTRGVTPLPSTAR